MAVLPSRRPRPSTAAAPSTTPWFSTPTVTTPGLGWRWKVLGTRAPFMRQQQRDAAQQQNGTGQESRQHLNGQPRKGRKPLLGHTGLAVLRERWGFENRDGRQVHQGRLGRQCKSGSATPGQADATPHHQYKQSAVSEARTRPRQQPKHCSSASLGGWPPGPARKPPTSPRPPPPQPSG